VSARVSLQARVEQYLAERRKLGFALRSMGHGLPSFARYVASAGHHGPLTVELMATWASQAKGGRGDRATSARRLKMLRPFTGWLRQFEPATEVPDEAVFGAVPGRMTPHVYREPEIIELLAAARKLGPEGGLRPAVMETLFGLIACTGLRISEAQGLLDADVDLKDGVLTIRQSKFGKSRLVPLHPSAVEALARYRTQRARHLRSTPELPFFVASRGRLLGEPVGTTKSTASSTICDGNWAGLTAAAMARRASTICATPSPCAGWCCGTSRAWTSASGCWRCRPTSATSRSPAPTGISPACRS
jgi:integrase